MQNNFARERTARVLISGASGFLGQALSRYLRTAGYCVTALSRHAPKSTGEPWIQVHHYDEDYISLKEQDCVVHLAARVHVMSQVVQSASADFRTANVDLTFNLAQQAARAGVRRFIFISSVKVNGECTVNGQLFHADETPAPKDFYGISKLEAEVGLRSIAAQTGMEVVIIRPPLVYGPGVKANFAAMVRWLQCGLPLPLGAIDNRRSLVALDNLVDLIVRCIDHPAAANRTFMVSDGEDVSTTELLKKMAYALDIPARLIPVPQKLMVWGTQLFSRPDIAQRLFSSLQVDIGSTRQLLDWTPPLSMDEGLAQVARHVQGK